MPRLLKLAAAGLLALAVLAGGAVWLAVQRIAAPGPLAESTNLVITRGGTESIAAVLDPEVHDYLYMVADGTGGHAFARTYEEHQANVANWRQYRREKGI